MHSLEQELSAGEIAHIKNKLEENARIIDAALERCLDISGGEDYADLTEAMKYGALSGGKRIRGFLTRACFEMFGGRDDQALPVACAVELVHAYSLVHDDLPCMDDDDTRRGQPSCHVKFGETTALLAGDALLALAFNILARAENISAGRRLMLIAELSQAAGHSGMVGGQTMDLKFAGRQIDDIRLIKLHTMKTGALIIAAARAGAIAAGAGGRKLELIGEYAKNLALAFQVVDDALDGDGFAAVLGKDQAAEYARSLTLEALLKLEGLKNAELLALAAKYLLYREY